MDADRHPDQTVRRIVLPSGKTIEVLRVTEGRDRFTDSPAGPEGAALAPEPAPQPEPAAAPEPRAMIASGDPHVCPCCESALVYPVAWAASTPDRWRVELRCPNCERTEAALLGLEIAERFDDELERGAETLVNDLKRLTEANMLADLARLSAALEVDALLPADFCR